MKDFSNNILIIDDSVAYYRLLMESMCDNGDKSLLNHILFAENAEKGLELYVTNRPMVVLLDVRMPGKSGIDAAKMIINYDKSANIMLVTNYPDDNDVSMAVSDHLVSNTLNKGVGTGVIASMIAIILKTVGKLL
jgi:DNA-binding NarL/FixJ family response regulator